jgi:endonuclease/exonuclease/phosphatase family metal-dependent hydrolase
MHKSIKQIIMKILSFNVNNDYRNTTKNATTIVDMISRIDPDIVGLQEVTPSMYDALENSLLFQRYNVSDKQPRSYFNVMISKFPDGIVEIPFIETSMSRSFLKQYVASLDHTFITTHLESVAQNRSVRSAQCQQMCSSLNGVPATVFGDTNFCSEDERMADGMAYITPTSTTEFSYDYLLNPNAHPPFRTNLDRFYTNIPRPKVDILVDVTFSDHFPIMMTA